MASFYERSSACFLAIFPTLVSVVSAQPSGCTYQPWVCTGFLPFISPLRCCNDVCTNVRYDPMNCGYCSFRCPQNVQCINGICQASSPPWSPPSTPTPVPPTPLPPTPVPPTPLPPTPVPPTPTPVPPTPTPLGPSPPPPDCASNPGICGAKTCCDNKCVDLASDPENCGICGGRCSTLRTCCSGRCANIRFDPYNCGRCFNICEHRQICFLGHCYGRSNV